MSDVSTRRNAIPSVVVFDLGKVLVDFDYTIAARKIASGGKMLAEKIYEFIAVSPLLLKYETGLLTREQFFDAICEATGYCGNIDEFGAFFADIFTPIDPMVELHAGCAKPEFLLTFFPTPTISPFHIFERTFHSSIISMATFFRMKSEQ